MLPAGRAGRPRQEKPLYSHGRVALLPFPETQNDLYKEYKLDEPWDSDNNKKVLAKMPKVFQAVPVDGATNPSYFVFTGKQRRSLAAMEGTKLNGHNRDGTSNTLLVVEAKADIPWTKPEDLQYDPKKPLPKLGGYFAGGFNAAMADGRKRPVPSSSTSTRKSCVLSLPRPAAR